MTPTYDESKRYDLDIVMHRDVMTGLVKMFIYHRQKNERGLTEIFCLTGDGWRYKKEGYEGEPAVTVDARDPTVSLRTTRFG